MDNNFSGSDSLNSHDFNNSNHSNQETSTLHCAPDVVTFSNNSFSIQNDDYSNLPYNHEQQNFVSQINEHGILANSELFFDQQQNLPEFHEVITNHYVGTDVKPHVSQLHSDDARCTSTSGILNNELDSDLSSSLNAHHNFDPNNPHGIVIGNPTEEMKYWHQQISSDACGIATQQSAIEHINHQSYSQEQLLHDAQDNQWYSQHIGTPAEDFGKLITEETHVPIETHYHANIHEIIDKLHHGEEVFVGVNSDIEWLPDHNSLLGQVAPDLFDPHQYKGAEANHIVQVIGVEIDPINPHNSYVIVNDSSSPDGRGMEIPLDQFQEAMNPSHGYIAFTEIHHNNLSENSDHTMAFRGCDNYGFDKDRKNFYVGENLRGHCEGRKFYTGHYSSACNTYKGCIGTDMNIYDARDVKVGYLDSCGRVHNNQGVIVVSDTNHSGFSNAAYYLLNLIG